jgi:hypothetical protein
MAMTERDMLDRLLVRYGRTYKNGSYRGRQFVRAEQVPTVPGRDGARIADFIALDQWATRHEDLTAVEQEDRVAWSARQSIHGHEVKVSRSDVLAELKHPEKAEAWARHCHYWWLVVSEPKLVSLQEIPGSWGVMTAHGPSVRVVRRARRVMPAPLPTSAVAALGRAVMQTEVRAALAERLI